MRKRTWIDRHFERLGLVLLLLTIYPLWFVGAALPAYYFGEWIEKHWLMSACLYFFFVMNLGTYCLANGIVELLFWANRSSKRMFD